MPYAPIIGTLAYVWDRATDSVLMVRREGRASDVHRGKYNGLGGKLEPRENVVAGVRRELWEEAQIELLDLRLRGTVNWPGFGANGEDWLGFVFLCERWTGMPPESNEEGSLLWVPRGRLLRACSPEETASAEAELPMWDGDRFWLPFVFDDDARLFHGVLPWQDGQPVTSGWHVERL